MVTWQISSWGQLHIVRFCRLEMNFPCNANEPVRSVKRWKLLLFTSVMNEFIVNSIMTTSLMNKEVMIFSGCKV